MKALILYRSYHSNTKKVAEAMADALAAQEVESVVQDLRRKLPDLSAFDLILIGSPTRMARVTRKAKQVLKQIRKKGIGDKPVAVFDTYGPVPTNPEELEKGKKWLYPGAAGILYKLAKTLGLNVYPKTLRCEVAGLKGPLGEKELEKAASFAKEFAAEMRKRP